jgi:hypothetical protein
MQRELTVEDLARKLKPLFGKKIDELYFRYSIAESKEEKTEIFQIISSLYQKHLSQLLEKGILLEPPLESDVKGNYSLGKVVYGDKQLFDFGLREKDWPRHVCVSGMSGSGKTTFAFNILENLIEKEKPFLVFDWKKSFRPLVAKDPGLMNFTIGNSKISNLFKTNINRPPEGISPKEWINTLCDLLTESFMVSFGVHKILLETLDEIFEAWGVYKGSELYPNWQHVKKMLEIKSKDAKNRESSWYESALRIATVLTFGDFGKVVNYDGKKSLSVDDLFDKRVIFELNSLSNVEKKFFCEYILTYIYKFKKSKQNKINQGFDHTILVDEAHNIFLKNKTNFLSESVTDMIYREMREYGTSLICLDQHVSKLSDTVTGNSACHIAFQQQLPEDIKDISQLMQMGDNKETFSSLEVGQAIVKLADRHTKPFLIQAPFIDLREIEVNDEKIKSRMECLVQGLEMEKNDPEFKEQIMQKNEEEDSIEIKHPRYEIEFPTIKQALARPTITDIKTEIPENTSEDVFTLNLTKTQRVLYDFVLKKLNGGKNLVEIERLLEKGLSERKYSEMDVMEVINLALKNQFSNSPKEEVIHIEEKKLGELETEEKKFITYLMNNPFHKMSTVELYTTVGLSSRKGNVIKKKLLEKGLISIEEIKYAKGWKKFIRLSI